MKYYTRTDYDYQIIRIQLAKIFKASLPKFIIINKMHEQLQKPDSQGSTPVRFLSADSYKLS